MKRLLLVLAAAAAAFAADGSKFHEDFHYSYPQTAGGRLLLDSFNGSIEITGWDQNTVDISGTRYAETQELLNSVHVEASSAGNAVTVRTTHPENMHGSAGAKYVVRVPRRTGLERIHSSNGSLRVENVDGNNVLTTSNGAVHLSGIRGDTDATSSNGAIEASNVDGKLTLHTSNGSIHGEDIRGLISAKTSNGSVHIHLRDTPAGEPIQLSTSNGGVDLQLDNPRNNDVIASTSNGGITVRLPAGTHASVNAHTSGNELVRSDFEILVRGEISKHRLEGTIGGGGPKLDLATSNGSIHLVKL